MILAPRARIIVLDYPQLLPASPAEQNCAKLREYTALTPSGTVTLGLSQPEQNFLRSKDSQLNEVLRRAARDSGVAEFAPVAWYFAGHEVCGNQGEWINGPSPAFKFPPVADQSFHPKAIGQLAYSVLANRVINPH